MDWEYLRASASRAFARIWLSHEERKLLRRTDPYADWRAHNQLSPSALLDLQSEVQAYAANLPKISVVMPIYRPNLDYFRLAVSSLQAQIIADWELCFCDDGSSDPSVTQELERVTRTDARVKFTSFPTNRGIAAATNAAVALATGDVLLFMDQDDELAPDCLAEFSLAFAKNSALELAYSDSDKISTSGGYTAPSFKPGWSPVLLLAYMYLSHAVAMTRDLFDRVGGFRSAFDGSQDYDLILRASEQVRDVHHIPRVLYHWRCLPGSTAISAKEKPGSVAAGQRAVGEALERRSITAQVVRPEWAEKAAIGLFELRFPPYAERLTIIVFDEPKHPIQARWLDWLIDTAPPSTQFVLAAKQIIMGDSEKTLSRCDFAVPHKGLSLASRINHALALATGEMVLILRSGSKFAGAHWLDQMCGYASLPGVGLAGVRQIRENGLVDSAGFVGPLGALEIEPAFAGHRSERHDAMYLARTAHECVAVSAACAMIPRSVAAALPALEADFNDCVSIGVALSERVRALGNGVLVCANCDVYTTESRHTPPSMQIQGEDRWYNRNLGQGALQFTPARRSPPVHRTAPLRVVAVTHNLDREGAQTTLFDLLAGLKRAGLAAPIVVSSRAGELGDAMVAIGIPVVLVPAPSRRALKREVACYKQHLASAFAELGAEVVLANTLSSFAAISAASEAGIGSIWWQHEGGSWHHYFRRIRYPIRARMHLAFAQSYRVIQVASATRVQWLPVATRANFEIIRNGIPLAQLKDDLSRWDRVRARTMLGLLPDDCCVVLLGSVSARKGQADIIRALAGMPAHQGGELRIMVVGAFVDARYRAKIDTILRRLPEARRDQISFLGAVPDTALYLTAADIFVCCSRQESAPRSIVEAMYFGLPIISTPVDGVPEIVTFGKNAHEFSVGNYKELASILLELSSSPADRHRLGRASRELASQLGDFGGMVLRFATLLREAARLR